MAKDNVKVVILAGGMGTRLREETEFKPKPMVLIGEVPILFHIMKIYAHYGFNEFVVALGYKGEMIKEYFINYLSSRNDIEVDLKSNKVKFLTENHDDIKVTLVDTGLETLTGARIRKCKKYLPGTFMVTYGDGLADINIADLYKYHKEHGKLATITGVHPSSRFGELNVKDQMVIDFKEKPQVSQSYINGGFFVFENDFLKYLEGDDKVSLEHGPLEAASKDGNLVIYKHDGFWRCIDTHKDFLELNAIHSKGAPWEVWKNGKKN